MLNPAIPRVWIAAAPECRERLAAMVARAGAEAHPIEDARVLATHVSVSTCRLVIACELSSVERGALLQQLGAEQAWLELGPPEPARPLDGRWSYRCSSQVDDALLLRLIGAGLGRYEWPRPASTPSDGESVRLTRAVLDAAAGLSALLEPEPAADYLVHAAVCIASADRGWCWFYDADEGVLYEANGPEASTSPADQGLVALCARTRGGVCLPRAAEHRVFGAGVDKAHLAGEDRVLCHALVGTDGVCHGVLMASRRARSEPFSSREEQAFANIAQLCGPIIGQIALRRQLEGSSAELEGTFRQEALRAHAQRSSHGDVLRVSPAWLEHAYLGGVALLVVLVVFACVGQVHQYASGSAIIRTDNRFGVVSHAAGTVASVDVTSGDCIADGQVLVRLLERGETAALEGIERRWNAQLREYLLDPHSSPVRQAVASLRRDRREAVERVEQHRIRAPRAGLVGAVHTRVGTPIAPGDVALSVVDTEAHFEAIAYVPASDAPQIHRGAPLRLQLGGRARASLALEVTSVSQEAMGAAAVARALGPLLADVLVVPGASVEVRAVIPSGHFEMDGGLYPLREGMLARADVRLRSEPLIALLFPWLPGF